MYFSEKPVKQGEYWIVRKYFSNGKIEQHKFLKKEEAEEFYKKNKQYP